MADSENFQDDLVRVLESIRDGDFSVEISVDHSDEDVRVASAVNGIVSRLNGIASESRASAVRSARKGGLAGRRKFPICKAHGRISSRTST